MTTTIPTNCITVNTEVLSRLSDTNLTPDDWTDLLDNRGLDLNWCFHNVKRITKSVTTELGFYALSGGLLLIGMGGLQFKPDIKPTDKNGKEIKYVTLSGKGEAKYDAMLPLHPELKETYWNDIESLKALCPVKDEYPIIHVAEKFFAAIAGCSNGIPTIGIPGTPMWSKERDEHGNRIPLDIFKHFASHGFGFCIVLASYFLFWSLNQ